MATCEVPHVSQVLPWSFASLKVGGFLAQDMGTGLASRLGVGAAQCPSGFCFYLRNAHSSHVSCGDMGLCCSAMQGQRAFVVWLLPQPCQLEAARGLVSA